MLSIEKWTTSIFPVARSAEERRLAIVCSIGSFLAYLWAGSSYYGGLQVHGLGRLNLDVHSADHLPTIRWDPINETSIVMDVK